MALTCEMENIWAFACSLPDTDELFKVVTLIFLTSRVLKAEANAPAV